jgi:hypothetical protein
MSRFRQAFQEWAPRARKSPAEAVGDGLDRLIKLAERGEDAAAYAYKSPVANVTWMQRGYLSRQQLQTAQLNMMIPYACRITGAHVNILLVDALGDGVTFVEPPIQALDVLVQLNRAEVFTARTDKLVSVNQDAMVCSLDTINNTVRSFEMELNADDNVLSTTFKWAVPLTGNGSVEQYEWGGVQISLNWFVDPHVRYGENPYGVQAFAKPRG